jgi:hypothetical protein
MWNLLARTAGTWENDCRCIMANHNPMSEYENHAWYCVRNGNRLGPMPWETLRERAWRGELDPDDLVWAAPFQNAWRPAGSVAGLFPEPSASTPAPPVEPAVADHASSPGAGTGSDRAARPSSRRAFGQVWQSMVQVLFRPFDLSRWFSIGFCAWLAQVGGRGPNLRRVIDLDTLKEQLAAGTLTMSTLSANLLDKLAATPVFTLAMLLAAGFSLLLAVICCWLRARGSLMFLHRINHPRATIREAWQAVGETARSLFWWRLGLGALGLLALLAIGLGAALSLGIGLLRSGNWAGIGAAMTLSWVMIWGGGLAFLLCIWSALKSLSFHFMEPFLYRDREGIWSAWQRVWGLCRDYPLAILRYYALLFIFVCLAGLALLCFVAFSCCLGALLLILPVIGAVVMLPLLWLHRGLGLAFLEFEG